MRTIENKYLSLSIDDDQSTFSIKSKEFKQVEAAGLKMNILGNKYWRTPFIAEGWNDFIFKTQESGKDEPHGLMQMISLERGFQERNIKIQILFAIPENYSFLLWKILISNLSSAQIELDKLMLLENFPDNESLFTFGGNKSIDDLAFFSNGWQSWSYTAAYGRNEKMRISRLKAIQGQQWHNPSTPYPKKQGQFVSDFFSVIGDRKTRYAWVAGFLSQKNQFGTIQADLSDEPIIKIWADSKGVRINPSQTIETDWAYLQPICIDERDALGTYFDAVKRENTVRLDLPKPTGWCSWYEFYTHIDDEKISKNLESVSKLKNDLSMQLFQIDDGYETQIGDWLTFKDTFKNGMKPHARAITREGLTAGLWQAPFIVHKASTLYKKHREWMLRSRSGGVVNSGFNWNSFTTALDLSNSEALDYVGKVTETAVKEWGYQYLKLDFLYAAALVGVFKDPTRNRAEVLRIGMQSIRHKVGKDVFLLGCGAPLGSMLGIVDGMRIGADVLDKWKTNWYGMNILFEDEPNTPSACNAIQNIISRSGMHNRWWINDPDVLLIREHSRLTIHEIQSLASIIALSGGMLLLSDDLTKLGEERLQIAQKLIPQLDQRPWVLDWFDRQMAHKLRLDMKSGAGEWYLLSISNWQDEEMDITITPEDFYLPNTEYWSHSFWDGELSEFSNKKPLILRNVSAHGTIVLAVRKLDKSQFLYLGSDLHISQGNEVKAIKKSRNKIELFLDLGRNARGNLICFCPWKVKQVRQNGNAIQFIQDEKDVLTCTVNFEKTCRIEIQL